MKNTFDSFGPIDEAFPKNINLDNTPLDFGKYKGQTPNQIAKNNPGYIVWLYQKIDPKLCTKTLYLACSDEEDYRRDERNNNLGEAFWNE